MTLLWRDSEAASTAAEDLRTESQLANTGSIRQAHPSQACQNGSPTPLLSPYHFRNLRSEQGSNPNITGRSDSVKDSFSLETRGDFPGNAVVKTPPSRAGGAGSVPVRELRSDMPRGQKSKI